MQDSKQKLSSLPKRAYGGCHVSSAQDRLVSEHSSAKLECKGGRSVCVCEHVETTSPRDKLSTICSDKLRTHLPTARPVATCMDADDDLQLNLAGFEQPASRPKAQAKSNRHTVSFKKQQKVLACPMCPARNSRTFLSAALYACLRTDSATRLLQKQKQAQREGRQHRIFSDQSSGADATKSASVGALKGYELTASKPQAPISSIIAKQHEQQKQQSQHTQAPTTSPPNVFPSRSQAGKKPAAPQVQQRRHEPYRRNDEVSKVAVSNKEAKREHIARKAKRDRAAFEGDFA